MLAFLRVKNGQIIFPTFHFLQIVQNSSVLADLAPLKGQMATMIEYISKRIFPSVEIEKREETFGSGPLKM